MLTVERIECDSLKGYRFTSLSTKVKRSEKVCSINSWVYGVFFLIYILTKHFNGIPPSISILRYRNIIRVATDLRNRESSGNCRTGKDWVIFTVQPNLLFSFCPKVVYYLFQTLLFTLKTSYIHLNLPQDVPLRVTRPGTSCSGFNIKNYKYLSKNCGLYLECLNISRIKLFCGS